MSLQSVIRPWLLSFSWMASCALVCTSADASDKVSFSRDVRTILATHCFKCHGPDDEKREAGLRLDLREAAIGESDSGLHAIVPGDLAESELVRRITYDDEAEVMPPVDTKHPLSTAQIEILKQWVAQGAKYEKHWAFIAPAEAPLPSVQAKEWPKNEIDYFVLAQLESQGLHPSPSAESRTLVRRLYLDLIGLPPTPREVQEFVDDPSPAGYAKIVDRLLASPHSQGLPGSMYKVSISNCCVHRWMARAMNSGPLSLRMCFGRLSVFKYIETFYNPVRLHQTLGYKSPNEFEAEYAPVLAA